MKYCEAFGHKYELWKYDGKTFFKCEECGDILKLDDPRNFPTRGTITRTGLS